LVTSALLGDVVTKVIPLHRPAQDGVDALEQKRRKLEEINRLRSRPQDLAAPDRSRGSTRQKS
jgi:hypothetical protein